ncbi:MAG: ABC transporter permease [Bdellovibrionales bacterium]|nr:ABC transporter permease [Bdellovibrionales bacterium]
MKGAFSILGFLFFLAGLSFFIDYDPYFINLTESFALPSWSHPFGLDENGQGLFLQILYGIRVSLIITTVVVSLSFFIGLIVGTVSGYLEGWIEMILMALVDLVLAFPKFLMALALISMLENSIFNLIFALTFSTWAGFARLIRTEVKHLKKREFVLQSKSNGASSIFLIYRHIWPNLLGVSFIHGLFQVAGVLIAESGLSFLGLGISIEKPSLGSLLGMGRNHIFLAPHIILFPSLILFLLLFSVNKIADSLKR